GVPEDGGEEQAAEMRKSWFSAESSLRVYSEYLELDKDENGMLSKEELINYVGSRVPMRLTPIFIQRIYEEINTYPTQPLSEGCGDDGGDNGRGDGSTNPTPNPPSPPDPAPSPGTGSGPGNKASPAPLEGLGAGRGGGEMDYKTFL
ncbi:unnamed protein product, partial [Discosporangium mesarthrocarpum]